MQWWRRTRKPEPVLTDEILNGIIERLMRIDENVQLLVDYVEEDGEEED